MKLSFDGLIGCKVEKGVVSVGRGVKLCWKRLVFLRVFEGLERRLVGVEKKW